MCVPSLLPMSVTATEDEKTEPGFEPGISSSTQTVLLSATGGKRRIHWATRSIRIVDGGKISICSTSIPVQPTPPLFLVPGALGPVAQPQARRNPCPYAASDTDAPVQLAAACRGVASGWGADVVRMWTDGVRPLPPRPCTDVCVSRRPSAGDGASASNAARSVRDGGDRRGRQDSQPCP